MKAGLLTEGANSMSKRPKSLLPLYRTAVAVTAALALVATSASPAAATYYSGGMPSINWNYRVHGVNPTWVEFFDTGNIRWNQRVSSRLGRSNSAAADATAGDYSASWYGLYTPHGIRGVNRTFTLQINARTLRNDFPNSAIYKRQALVTITHELGHGLSMADNPNTSSRSIMKYSDIDSLAVEVPTAYDIAEVARIY